MIHPDERQPRGSRESGLPLAEIRRLYNEDYYLEDCDGHSEFLRTEGRKLPRRLAKCLRLLSPEPGSGDSAPAQLGQAESGQFVIDIGCGRGELALHLAARGARVVALDPSPAAAKLSRSHSVDLESLPNVPPGTRDAGQVFTLCARGENLPLAPACADAILLSDVVEHLPPRALDRLFRECARVLRPGGRVVIHTQPNRLLLDWTVPVARRFSRLWGVHLPADLREEMTEGAGPEYHVNEQTRRGLGRSLRRAGLNVHELWLEGTYPIHRIFGESRTKPWIIARFRRHQWIKELFASQIFAVATRPTA